MLEEPKLCTTSGEPVDKVRAEQTQESGQFKSYIILCPDERAKGFVRPYRDSYKHTGRSICGKMLHDGDDRLGGPRRICSDVNEHAGECGVQFQSVTQPEHAQILNTHLIGGCGTVTTMGRAIAETFARSPSFYGGGGFCCNCNRHVPNEELRWTADGEVVGS